MVCRPPVAELPAKPDQHHRAACDESKRQLANDASRCTQNVLHGALKDLYEPHMVGSFVEGAWTLGNTTVHAGS
jgi:hypothetical protein